MLYISRGRRHSLSLGKTKHLSSSHSQHPAPSDVWSPGATEAGGEVAGGPRAPGLLQEMEQPRASQGVWDAGVVTAPGEPDFILLLFSLTSSPGNPFLCVFPPGWQKRGTRFAHRPQPEAADSHAKPKFCFKTHQTVPNASTVPAGGQGKGKN